MAKKQLSKNQTDVNEIVKKVKSVLLETIVREWLNTRCTEFNGLTPLQVIKKGEGQKILDALSQANVDFKNERNLDGTSRNSEDNEPSKQESILFRIEGS